MSDYILKIIYEHFGVIAVCATVLIVFIVSFYPNVRLVIKDIITGVKYLWTKLVMVSKWIKQKLSQGWEWVRVRIFKQLPKNSFAYFFRQSTKSRERYVKGTIKCIGKRKYAKAQKVIKSVFIDASVYQITKEDLSNALETMKPVWENIAQNILENEYDDILSAQYLYLAYPNEAKICALIHVVRLHALTSQALYRIAYYYGFRQEPSLVEEVVQRIGYIGDSSGFRYSSQLKKLNENFILAALTGDKRFIENNGAKHE